MTHYPNAERDNDDADVAEILGLNEEEGA